MQRLTGRELFAVNPMGVITGSVFTDLADDGSLNAIVDASGATVNDPTINGVDVDLYLDNNTDGAIDGGDTLIGTSTTSGSGTFRFEGLEAGEYLLSQDAVAGLIAPSGPVPVTVSDDDGQEVLGIDNFSEAFQLLTVLDASDPDVSDSAGGGAAASIIGGERDLLLANNSGSDAAELEVDGELKFSSQLGVVATALVQYDGSDGTSSLDATGLNGVDLEGANEGAGVLLGTFGDLAGGTLTVRIYTDANNASETTVAIPAAATIEEFFVPFSSFTTLGGASGPADFANVGAIEGFLEGVAGLDARVSVISSLAPVEVTQNLANLEPISLGDTLFQDDDDDGVQDPGEPGLAGIDVNLYADTNANGSFDSGTDTLVGTTTSGVGGNYLFEDLTPGEYLVQIPASAFSAGQPLAGYGSSLQTTAPDPDNNVDEDDNGNPLTAAGVVSQAITLISQGEPTDDGDADPSTNLTLDFGFVPEIDLVVTKTLVTTDPEAGGEADFEITITNNGPLTATNVSLSDPLPAGLTFNRVENVPGSVSTSVAGNTLTADIASLAAGAGSSVTFNVIAVIEEESVGETYTNQATIVADQRDTDPSNDSDSADVVTPSSDLRITKVDDSDPVSAGGTLTYTLQVFNDGPSDATGVVVTDTLPGDVTFVAGTIGGSAVNVSHNAGVVTAAVGDLSSGASETITIEVTVASDADATLNNSATVANSPNTDPNAANNSATASTTVERNVDLAITKSASASPIAGETLTYTFVVSNGGLGDARGVSVTDTLDANLSFDSFDAQASGASLSQAGDTLTFDLGTLAAGASATFSIDVLIDSDAAGPLDNTASVSTTDTDTDPANDQASSNITVGSQIDLAIAKDDSVTSAIPGDTLSYTLTATNPGPSDATGVAIVDTLPTGFTLSSVNAAGIPFTSNNGVVTFNVGDLAAGGSVTLVLNGTIASSATGTLQNSVTIDGNESDSDAANDAASHDTPLNPQFDLQIDKTTDVTSATPGETLTYTIDLSNAGLSDATNVVIADTLPAGVSFVSGAVGTTAATVSGSTVNYDVGTLAAGASTTATLVVQIDPATTGALTNQVTVTADAGDTDPANDDAAVTTTLTPAIDLAVTKAVSETTAAAGSELTYTITVSNAGPSAATGVTATDTLPAGVSFVSGTGPTGAALTATGQDVAVNIGTLGSGATAEFTIVATIDNATTADQTNTVTVATPISETNTDNNTATATTVIDRQEAVIEGFVYLDADDDGTFDAGETPLAGVTLNLTGTTAEGDTVSATTTTDADGRYRFTGLEEGTYRIDQVQPTSTQAGTLIADGQETIGQNATAEVEENGFSQIILGANVQATDFNFAEIQAPVSIRYYMSQHCSFLDQRT
jgi:uncharacterized repeat protein (TIGR01451 family)